jgi:hypothetical protein
MRRAVLLCGTTSFLMAFLGGMLAFSLVAPSLATAQAGQLEEVRASAFVLVGADGTTLARLEPGNQGGGSLVLNDTSGTRRLQLAGGGWVAAYEQDGSTAAFRAGRAFIPTSDGTPAVNGVLLGPGGSVSSLPTLP